MAYNDDNGNEVKTIADRFNQLKEWEDENQRKLRIVTEISTKSDKALACAKIYDGEALVATGHQERFTAERGESTVATAETMAVSRALGFLFRDSVVHSQEELEEVIRRETENFNKRLKSGMSLRDAKQYIRTFSSERIRSELQKILGDALAKKTQNEARRKTS